MTSSKGYYGGFATLEIAYFTIGDKRSPQISYLNEFFIDRFTLGEELLLRSKFYFALRITDFSSAPSTSFIVFAVSPFTVVTNSNKSLFIADHMLNR
jgi:hypothetical protein